MADKNLSRDESVLRKMLEHIDSIQEAVAYCQAVQNIAMRIRETSSSNHQSI